MFDLLIAIALGLFLLFKILSEKANSTTYDIKYKKKKKAYENFAETYQATAREVFDYDQKIKRSDPEIENLRGELRDVVGASPIQKMIEAAYFAKIGEIPHDVIFNISWNVLRAEHDLIWFNAYGRDDGMWIDDIYDARLKFLKWYDKELRSNGMPYKLLFVSGYRTDGRGTPVYDRRGEREISECTSVDLAAFLKTGKSDSIIGRDGWRRLVA